jgi:hypothetical protein
MFRTFVEEGENKSKINGNKNQSVSETNAVNQN